MENVYFSVKEDYKVKKGKILDVSSVGMACVFDDKDAIYREGTLFKEMQLCLKGVICIVDATISHHRLMEDGTNMYIVMFDSKKYNKFQDKVHHFVYKSLQDSLAKDFKMIGNK